MADPQLTPFLKTPPQETWDQQTLVRWLREIPSRIVMGRFTWNGPGVIAANTGVDTTLTSASASVTVNPSLLDAVRAGMFIKVTPPPSLQSGLVTEAWSATDQQLTVRVVNATVAGLTPAAGAWTLWGMGTV